MTTPTQNVAVHEALVAALEARKQAREQYLNALMFARAHGWTNQRIASSVGVTETAIRMMIARNKK